MEVFTCSRTVSFVCDMISLIYSSVVHMLNLYDFNAVMI